jgi:hypothetical protein
LVGKIDFLLKSDFCYTLLILTKIGGNGGSLAITGKKTAALKDAKQVL